MIYGSNDYKYELVDGWVSILENESFRDIGAVCVDENDDVLVLNHSNNPLTVFDPDGHCKDVWSKGHFSDRPHGMEIGPDKAIYTTDDGNHTVKKFSPSGELLMYLGTEGEPSETGYRPATDLFEQLSSITRATGLFNRPTGVTVSDSGDIFVSDSYGNARIHKFSSEGELLHSWGTPEPSSGAFRLPHSVHVDGDDRVWVTDRENSRIQIFDADGTV